MFKKLSLVALFFISNAYANTTGETSWTKKIKHSPALVKIFVAIIPCIFTFVAMDKVMINYKDDETIVGIAWSIKWAAAAIASIFGNLLMKVNFRKWISRNSLKSDYKKCHDINESKPILVQS
jgi:hypothetical protein